MRSYVLVHGAWHGGWCWSRVEPLLCAAGHRVFSPTLTGLGDREHLFGASVTLATHVRDVLALVESEELGGDLVLVGHSYGGNVVWGAADALRDRIAHCVFVDAVVPPDGTRRWRWADVNSAADRDARLAVARERGAGVALPAPAPSAFGVSDPADLAWLERRLRPMPIGTYTGAIDLPNGGAQGLARTYVAAVDPVYAPLAPVHARVQATPGWRWRTIATGHDVMVSAPRSLATLLLEPVD